MKLGGRCCNALVRRASPALLLALAACGQRESDPAPEAAGVGEARALGEAAAMLEEQRHEREEGPAPLEPATPSPIPSS